MATKKVTKYKLTRGKLGILQSVTILISGPNRTRDDIVCKNQNFIYLNRDQNNNLHQPTSVILVIVVYDGVKEDHVFIKLGQFASFVFYLNFEYELQEINIIRKLIHLILRSSLLLFTNNVQYICIFTRAIA